MSTPITQPELSLLKNAVTTCEWFNVTTAIRSSRGGAAPADWKQAVVDSGIWRKFADRNPD